MATCAPGSTFSNELADVHDVLTWVLFALIGLHVGAALFHRFVLSGYVWPRMLPRAAPSHQSHANRNHNHFRKGRMGKHIDDVPLARRRALAAELLLNGEGISDVSRKA
ncbi:cytochrome b/b6 domain-containing protein, partial [Paraburkholderia dipogonis]|uniref:cytochrome b/b6 domain-containing protein n=1 Tax=Paraburkholderia dipogonis TaxID=1211383 RepID=UPI0038BAF164